MPAEISPKQVQLAAQRGHERLQNFRNARLLFLRNYVGQYYDQEQGPIGTEALNLIFNAIRILLPNLVMNFPKHKVHSKFVAYQQYAELMSLALDQNAKDLKLNMLYRRVIVDALFTLGTLKTGIASSDSVYAINDQDRIDTGEVYTSIVDFDNLIIDPRCKEYLFADARFIGDRITVPRQNLLESGLYKNDLVERLPRAGCDDDRASDLSMRGIEADDNYDLEDEVEIVELWVPGANAIVTVPGGEDILMDDFLRVDDFYGPKEGPYTFLSLTPPVPGNPMPIAAVGVWNDLHILANRMAKKIIDQAERQKDVVAYKRSAADDAEALRDASDGETVATDDPSGVQVHSFGGQQGSNEVHLAQLQGWFNMMAANPQGVGGETLNADSATEATILQANASITLEDMKDQVYTMSAEEGRRRMWYFHTDPFINVPLIRRVPQPQMLMSDMGPLPVGGPMMGEEQVFLTPEVRDGDFLDYSLTIEPESMGRMDSATRLRKAMEFTTQALPAVVTAAQSFAMLGLPFSPRAYLLHLAKDAGIDWLDEVFFDPQFQMQVAQTMMQLPGPQKGIPGQTGPGGIDAIMQNGQPANIPADQPGPLKQARQLTQEGAFPGQQETH